MGNSIFKKINNIEFLLTILCFIPVFLIDFKCFGMDTYWLILQGEKFSNFTFFNTISNTVHNFSYIPQQWLTSFIIYHFYKLFNMYGVLLFVSVFSFLLIFLTRKLFVLIAGDTIKGNIFTFIFSLVFFFLYVESRPQIISFSILITLILCLENYIRKNNKKYLYVIPLLFILQINIHATCFPFLILIMFSYIVNFKSFIKGSIIDFSYNKINIIICLSVSFILLFINPYKEKAITYIFYSLTGDTGIKEYLSYEMRTLSINNHGIIFLIASFILFLIFFTYKNKVNLHLLILLIGSTFLFWINIRSLIYFSIGFLMFLADYLKDIDNKKIIEKVFGFYQIQIPLLLLVFVIVKITSFSDYTLENTITKSNFNTNDINGVVEIIDKEGARIYSNYIYGGFFQFNNFDVYMNSHLEAYLKSVNKEKDIIDEYLLLQFGRLDEKEFIETYNFDYLVLNNTDFLYDYANKNLELVFTNNTLYVFKV